MGKNRQPTTSTDTTDTTDSTDSSQTTDFTQQQQQPAPSGSLEAPTGDDAISSPVIINR
jgi:hypothetical protein